MELFAADGHDAGGCERVTGKWGMRPNLRAVPQRPFPSEKALQRLIESNLDVVFKCRLVATEFSTGAQPAGRIDTLALSEDNNPVIIEYKNVESSDLIL